MRKVRYAFSFSGVSGSTNRRIGMGSTWGTFPRGKRREIDIDLDIPLAYPTFSLLIYMIAVENIFNSFRLERLNINSAKGRAKVIGTLICIGGAMIFTFWKGGYHFKGLTRSPLIDIDESRGSVHGLRHHKQDWIKGSLLILTSYVAWSVSLILQALVADVYRAPLTLNTLICFIASLQSLVLALFFEREPALWRLQWNVQLLTLIYAGIINSALGYYLQTWCIKEKGPVFSAMFCPLILVIVGTFSAIVFAERLHLGSLIGAFLIVLGLYTVLWGKSTNNCSEGKDGDDKSSLDHQTLEISIANQPLSMTNPTTNRKN